MAPEPNLPGDVPEIDDDPEAYVGLGQEAAEERAREQGWSTVRALPPGAMITMEYAVGRINFEVKDGVVARCWQG
ncbi:I78 family peptidase inhibitor [Streptomyces sp. S186]|uniref:I78 family peptidase inhibitor n=1 Tax=Streptomyces sp. S186 TaxID=3434395 RepID=UPI003F6767DE